jgi:hypothetical protein
MTKDEITAILDRVPSWPQQQQEELAEIALEIEAWANDEPYIASAEELAAIDEGSTGGTATPEEVAAAFAKFRRG